MTTEESIFAGALGKGSEGERLAYLDHACRGDAALRARVDALLAAHRRAPGILDHPPLRAALTRTAATPQAVGGVGGVGGTVGPYRLLEQIGEGGMGVVYMAEQSRPVYRKVALKIVKPGMDSRQVIARFEAERQALTMMEHPNIARVLDAGTTDDGHPYFAMELVRGIPITDYCGPGRG
jgi:serine/threonine protein kinase